MRQWQQALARLRRRPLRFRRLRFWLLILAASVTILAASQPRLAPSPGPQRLIILLDDSASMAAVNGVGESSWQRARALLDATLASLPENVSLQLALSSEAGILRGRPAEILAALPTAPAGEPRLSFADLAPSLVSEDQAVWTITDGRDPNSLPAVGALSLIGEDLGNVALVSCEIEDRWPFPEAGITIGVGSFGVDRSRIDLSLSRAGGLDTLAIELRAGRGVGHLDLDRDQGGMVEISLEGPGDALQLDDHLRFWLPPPPAPDIALLSEVESSLWLRKAAEVLAIESGGRVQIEPSGQAGFALVEGGWLQQRWGRGISFGTAFGEPSSTPIDARVDPLVLDWDRDDPVTKGLDLSDLHIARALDAKLLPEGKPLLWAQDGALMVLAGAGARRSLHLAFELSDSNLPLLSAFPQLLRRAFARCYGDMARARIELASLLSSAESDLHVVRPQPVGRALPTFGSRGSSLSVPLLLLALFAIAARVYA